MIFRIILCSVRSIVWFEKKYPLPSSSRTTNNEGENTTKEGRIEKENETTSLAQHHNSSTENHSDSDNETPSTTPVALPPIWLDRIMAVVYPGSLGVDEGIAHLTMKASVMKPFHTYVLFTFNSSYTPPPTFFFFSFFFIDMFLWFLLDDFAHMIIGFNA